MRKKSFSKEQFIQLMRDVADEFENDAEAQSFRLMDFDKPAGSEPTLVIRLALRLYGDNYRSIYQILSGGSVLTANDLLKNRYGIKWGNVSLNISNIHEKDGKKAACDYFREIIKLIENQE